MEGVEAPQTRSKCPTVHGKGIGYWGKTNPVRSAVIRGLKTVKAVWMAIRRITKSMPTQHHVSEWRQHQNRRVPAASIPQERLKPLAMHIARDRYIESRASSTLGYTRYPRAFTMFAATSSTIKL